MDKCRKVDFASDIQKTDSFWPSEFVRACAQHIDIFPLYMDGQVPVRLHGVRMENQLMFFCHTAKFVNGLNGADFVICIHNRKHAGVFLHPVFNIRQYDTCAFVYIQVCYAAAHLF